jgi:hypothetical protein
LRRVQLLQVLKYWRFPLLKPLLKSLLKSLDETAPETERFQVSTNMFRVQRFQEPLHSEGGLKKSLQAHVSAKICIITAISLGAGKI